MKKREVLDYVTRGIIKAASDNVPFTTGKLTCSYGEKANIITIKSPDDGDIVFTMTFYLWYATGGQYSVSIKKKNGDVVIETGKQGLYFYDGGDTKTDIQRKVLQPAENAIINYTTVYKAESVKSGRIQ